MPTALADCRAALIHKDCFCCYLRRCSGLGLVLWSSLACGTTWLNALSRLRVNTMLFAPALDGRSNAVHP